MGIKFLNQFRILALSIFGRSEQLIVPKFFANDRESYADRRLTEGPYELLILTYLALVSRYHSYLQSAVSILNQYHGNEPFAAFIKKYFALHKKFGSKDRKQISHLCYCYFRLGKWNVMLPTDERVIAGLFLCSDQKNELLEMLRPDLNQVVGKTLEQKSNMISPGFSCSEIFPWADQLEKQISFEKFNRSFLLQPELFLRIRPGYEKNVIDKLQKASLPFRSINDHCIEMPNASRVDQFIELDKEAVVQDLNSQRVGEFLADAMKTNHTGNQQVWDCCAASGGKSIMAYDIDPTIQLTISDLRPSILINLRKRFEKAGIKNYRSFTADLAQPSKLPLHHSTVDLVICDAPCSGSGTWSRTPEQLFFFKEEKIKEYATLQKKIVSRVLPYIKPGGFLLYCTCSVFREENHEVVDHLIQKHGMELKAGSVLAGYQIKADTLFAALLFRPKK